MPKLGQIHLILGGDTLGYFVWKAHKNITGTKLYSVQNRAPAQNLVNYLTRTRLNIYSVELATRVNSGKL